MNEEKKSACGHTPGPWRYEELNGAIYRDGNIDPFVSVHSLGDKQHATGRLIAAAPEMLEALEKMTELADQLLNEVLHERATKPTDGDEEQAEIDQARAAIAQARGEEVGL